MKQVRETKAGKSISVYVIMKGTRHVATVQAHYSDGGRVSVDVWNHGVAAEKCSAANKKDPETGWREYSLQQGSAGGGGYDKFTAALSGMWIDGHLLTDHCMEARKPPKGRKTWPAGAKPPKGRKTWPAGAKPPKGWSLHNWRVLDNGEEGWTSCYKHAGLRYLEELGYKVISAI